MSLLHKYIPFVKEQIDFQQRMMVKFADHTFRETLHRTTKEKFAALMADIEVVDKLINENNARPAEKLIPNSIRLSITPQELDGLPEEVLKELSISEGDKTEFAILGLIEDAGGIMSLDQIIVGLWKKTGEAIKRQALTSRLYRMGQKDLIFGVPTKKGVYSTRPISEDEATKLLAGEPIEE